MSDDPFNRQVGPQLTEYTGNRIASALERIADTLDRMEKRELAAASDAVSDREWINRVAGLAQRGKAYPSGDPAPFPSSGEVEALVAGIGEMIEKSGATGTVKIRLPDSYSVKVT